MVNEWLRRKHLNFANTFMMETISGANKSAALKQKYIQVINKIVLVARAPALPYSQQIFVYVNNKYIYIQIFIYARIT